jgi:hypothetical protein
MGNLHTGDALRLTFSCGHGAADCFNIATLCQPSFQGGAQ